MEISERALHRMVREVDDMNREGMETMDEDIAELHAGEGKRLMGTSRRRFVQGVGLGGFSLAIGGALIPLSSLWSSAYAADSADKGIAQFAESVELAAVAAYGAAVKTGKVTTPAVAQAAETFAAHHKAHAAAFGAYAGDASKATANPKLVASIGPMIAAAADQTAIVKIAYGLENAAASTYLFAIGALTDPAALKATASILPVESQHAVVLGHVLGESLGDNGTYIPAFINTSAAVSPTEYPITPGT